MKNIKEIDIKNTIRLTAKETAEEVIKSLKYNNMVKNEISYYKRVEILLYNRENIIEAIKQKDEDIYQIKDYGLPQKSKSIVMYSSAGGNISEGDRIMQLIERYKMEKAETERDLVRINNALDKIKEDKYYKIIELKYLVTEESKIATDSRLAETLGVDQATISRNRKRLINKLITILFPQSLKDFA